MIKFKERIIKEIKTNKIPDILICDLCKAEYKYEGSDLYEIQEFHHIRKTGGYGSIFGDETTIKCDICQHCLYKILKGHYIEED